MRNWLQSSVLVSVFASIVVIVVCAGALLAPPAHAQAFADKTNIEIKPTAPAPLLDEGSWIILGGISRHTCRDCGFRESNPGLAMQWKAEWLKEYTDSNDWRLTAGAYINSNNRNSVYAGVQWLPIEYGVEYGVVKAGVQAAVITNYLKKSILPTLLPTISIETKYIGADIFLVPKFPSVSSAVLLSFKVRY